MHPHDTYQSASVVQMTFWAAPVNRRDMLPNIAKCKKYEIAENTTIAKPLQTCTTNAKMLNRCKNYETIAKLQNHGKMAKPWQK